MQQVTFYQMFGVPEDADKETLRQAWVALCKRYHPDTNPGVDPKILKQVNQVYNILKDPERRAHYDAWLASQRQPVQWMFQQWPQTGTGAAVTYSPSNTTIIFHF